MNNYLKYILSLLIIVSLVTACSRNRFMSERDRNRQQADTTKPESKDQYRIAENFQNDKSQIIDLIEGKATFEINYTGDSTFVARLMDHNGNTLNVLADVKGNYKGEKIVTVPKTDSYILDVRCRGTWSVSRK